MLDKQTVIQALKCPSKPLLDYALSYVNLTRFESICINLCIIQDITELEAADEINKSRDFVAKHKKQGIERIQKAWEHCPVVELLINYK